MRRLVLVMPQPLRATIRQAWPKSVERRVFAPFSHPIRSLAYLLVVNAHVLLLLWLVVCPPLQRETLKSRAAAAKSSKAVQEMVAGLRLNSTTAWAAFDKMEEKVVAMEAEVRAYECAGLIGAYLSGGKGQAGS